METRSNHERGLPAITSSAGALVAEIYDHVYAKLMSVDIEPGARLSVDALARELDVSQTPIREALGRLEADGLVVKNHLRGYRATQLLTRGEFDAMYDLRMLIEPFAAKQAARRRSDEHVATLEAIEKAMRNHVRGAQSHGRRGDFAVLDDRMHRTIVDAGGNQLIVDTLARLHTHLHIFRLRRDQTTVDEAFAEHHAVIDAIVHCDPYIAEAAMLSHIERSRGRIMTHFDSGT